MTPAEQASFDAMCTKLVRRFRETADIHRQWLATPAPSGCISGLRVFLNLYQRVRSEMEATDPDIAHLCGLLAVSSLGARIAHSEWEDGPEGHGGSAFLKGGF